GPSRPGGDHQLPARQRRGQLGCRRRADRLELRVRHPGTNRIADGNRTRLLSGADTNLSAFAGQEASDALTDRSGAAQDECRGAPEDLVGPGVDSDDPIEDTGLRVAVELDEDGALFQPTDPRNV